MDNRPIGIFDSGLGGLTAVKEFHRLLPKERLVYFGDTARVPYGSRSRETIRKYVMQDIQFLLRHNCKIIVAACGTASATITNEMVASIGLPFSGVILPSAQAACAASTNNRIGIIGTTATVRSGAYGRAIRAINPDAHTYGSACPLFVPLVENGFIQPDNEITTKVAQLYLKPIIGAKVDTLILGCTHYPLIYPIIDRLLASEVTLIDPGKEAARWAQNYLASHDMLSDGDGVCTFYVSDSPDGFIETADIFLGGSSIKGDVHQVDVESL